MIQNNKIRSKPFRKILNSFKNRLTIILFLISLIPIALLSITNLPKVENALTSQILSSLEAESSVIAISIKTYLERFPEIILALSESPPIREISNYESDKIVSNKDNSQSQLLDRINQWFLTEVRCNNAISQLRFINELGMEIINIENINGVCEVKTNTNFLQDQSEKKYFEETRIIGKGEIYLSYQNQENSRVSSENLQFTKVRFSTPVFNQDNNFKGIIVVNVQVSKLTEFVKTDIGNLYILDDKGDYLFKDNTNKENVDKNSDLEFFLATYPDESTFHPGKDLFSTTKLNAEYSLIISYNKIRLFQKPLTNWVVIRTLPKHDALIIPHKIRKNIIIMIILVIVIISLTAKRIAVGVAASVNELKNEALKIADGEFLHVTETGNDYIENHTMDEFKTIHLSLLRISKNFELISEQARKISNGDFTAVIHPRSDGDNIAESFNKMARNLEKKNLQIEASLKKQTNLANLARDSEQSMMNILEDVQEAELKVKQALYYAENITNSLTAALFVLDTEGMIIKVNPDACSLLGYLEDELIGLSVNTVFKEGNDLESIIRLKKNFIDGLQIGYLYIHKSGVIMNVNHWIIKKLHFNSVEDLKSKNIDSIMNFVNTGLTENLTKSLKNDETISSTYKFYDSREEEYHLNFDIIPSHDEHNKTVGLSVLVYHGNSMDQEEIAGYNDILETENIGILFENLNEDVIDDIWSTNDHVFINHERSLITKSGNYLPVLMSGSLLREVVSDPNIEVDTEEIALGIDDDIENEEIVQGNITGAVFVAKDITDLKAAEKEHQELLGQIHSQSKLATLGQLATGVAHELNQPLTYINTTLQLLQVNLGLGKIDFKDLAGEVETSLKQIERVTDIINHLRMLGRDDQTSKENVSMQDIIDNSLLLLKNKIALRNINISFDIAKNLPEIYGNSTQIEQVIINLFQNAIDALEDVDGEKKITVNVKTDNYKVLMEFSDTGRGISKSDMEKIFDPFFTTKEVGKGTGLGLSICNGIIENHGGNLTCESELGAGTVFTLSLPISSTSWQ